MNAIINTKIRETYIAAHQELLDYQLHEKETDKSILNRRKHLLEFLYLKLDEFKPEKDKEKFALFIKKLRSYFLSISYFDEFKTYISDIIKTATYIQMWMAETKGISSHIRCVAREKSIESTLTKIYNYADEVKAHGIRDSIGITWIIENDNINTLYQFSNYFVGIITGRDREAQADFSMWFASNSDLSEKNYDAIIHILTSNFDIEDRGELRGNTDKFNKELYPDIIVPAKSETKYPNGFKDYIVNPKENSYQALQGVFCFENKCFEVQFKTRSMDSNPHATHIMYEKKRNTIFTLNKQEVSKLKSYASKLNLTFNVYDGELDDKLGIHFPQFICSEAKICRAPL